MPGIKTLPAHLRPREKLLELGAENLADTELLAIVLRSGVRGKSALELAAGVLEKCPLPRLSLKSAEDLRAVPGLTHLKALELRAVFELARRVQDAQQSLQPVLDSPCSAAQQCAHIGSRRQEHFIGLYLNGRRQLVHKATLAIGGLNMMYLHPREVFAPALRHSASSVILAHNHPSGSLTASAEDISTTERLVQAGELIGVTVTDHLIVTKENYVSLREEGVV